MFAEYLVKWDLLPDGEPIRTHSSRLLPVRQHGVAAMLKVAQEPEEKFGAQLMVWWDGDGAARVLAHDADALLLERAQSNHALADQARTGDDEADDRAIDILCAAAARLHAPRHKPLPELIGLPRWFQSLWPAAQQYGGWLSDSAATAQALLAAPQDPVALHGDIHHGNVLDFAARGWLAIDPKGLYGERGFDYANIFCNPDEASALAPGRIERRVERVAHIAGLDRHRLLQWILAWSGLSAAWILETGETPNIDIDIGRMAAEALKRK
ncbi:MULTISPECIES: aminoglycoside phosphotransferase family protein [Paraburkholderia]|uniref:aminoglycoside phosphotransferase family protein n=1 Tax=Paraburkholderia TaxID=1822464 RepID=UPI00224E04E6|nr:MULTISPECIES: aminoglycoside phosphotransferase family protein [Paraburkholderia]MCX4153143.1 3'-kinase [Paraburkholderia aspalathi]MDN7162557.1 3'-kinase [Paraburkholderia sp. SECH2]MDQ6391043.1 3'-kinase [Paraburkholderia aspalathi]